MSATNHSSAQVNNKKGVQTQQNGSSAGAGVVSNSTSNTPAQTPNGSSTAGPMAPQQPQVPPPSQSASPPANNAPKYGTLVPNRVFVGGISANTTENELAQLFSAYGTVKATKIISDRAGVSKGYGFVTFESEEEAKRLQRESDNIMLRERRLNIAPAIKKQPFNRSFDVPSPPPTAATQAQFYYATAAAAAASGAVPYAAYQNGMAYYATPPPTSANGADPNAAAAQQPVFQAPPVYATPTAAPPAAPYHMPMYPPQPLFVHQQYPYQPIPYDPQQFYGGNGNQTLGSAQYMYNGGMASQQPATNTSGGVTGASSPSRHHHHHHQQQQAAAYYHQLAYNPPDSVYYNVPMYTIDPAAGCYSEGVDAAALNVMSEPSLMDHTLSGAHIHAMPSSSTPPSTGALPKHLTQQTQSQLTYNVVPVAERNGYAPSPSSDKTTPVVSLLSVEQAHERDFRSMQGGRKHRPDSVKQQEVNGIQPFRITGQQLNYMYSVNGFMKNYRKTDKCDSNQCRNTWSKKRKNFNNCHTESSSMSSLRTSSNSSANAVFDENLNEKKDKTNNYSPPPTSYSPMTIQNSQLADNPRNVFQNHMNPLPPSASYYSNQSGGGNSRRNRRNNARRNNNHQHHVQQQQQPPQAEIGAGDAPLQADVNEMCKKIDTIKL